ncbi:aspartate carbamoyltransferase [Trypanosoma rangeli]|uniref:aspartate carbamoyltransferase n=1 Tax=Trypanosoma rangeli TaxID=5698 RepID=A0A3R7N898_TRYRA|nr:aspartate carbamoyltransferase [Trypanosoma rangeli]RNF02000.1 aspartate carbamoyltransferase [Trypanosoma rangeli]|eukprot:RNF02000.1 aspartate carbamoyltransferase [Trypanosoma rangeli]
MVELQPVASLRGKSITSAEQLTRAEIDALLQLAGAMQRKVESGEVLNLLQGRIMTPLFFEDSSRTFTSFCAAMIRLGGSVVNFKVETSSINKGETLTDTIRTLDSYSDVLVMRHPRQDAILEALTVSQHPIMNAGNGAGEHPTQALLDTLTIHAELGCVDGITIALIGDLKMGRTVHSLLKLLVRNFLPKCVFLVAPDALQMPQDVLDSLQQEIAAKGVVIRRTHALTEEVMQQSDVLYATRLQKERFTASECDGAAAMRSFEAAKANITIDAARMQLAKQKMVLMHPLPRNDEVSVDVDADPRAAYFRQMRYGMYMRMALLWSVLA